MMKNPMRGQNARHLDTSKRKPEMDSVAVTNDNAVGSPEGIMDDLQEIVDSKMTTNC